MSDKKQMDCYYAGGITPIQAARDALAAQAHSLQRPCSALAWTHTKPTNGGLYLLRECPQTTPTMHHLYQQEDGRIQILDTESHYTGDDVQDLHADHEWFGPIPWE